MNTKIYKRDLLLKSVPYSLLLIVQFFCVMWTMSCATEKAENEKDRDQTLSLQGAREVPPELLKLEPVDEAQTKFKQMVKTIQFFKDSDFRSKIEKRENAQGRDIEIYKTNLVSDGWNAQTVVLTFLQALYRQLSLLIPITQQLQKITSIQQVRIQELEQQNQALQEKMSKFQDLEKSNQELTSKIEGLERENQELLQKKSPIQGKSKDCKEEKQSSSLWDWLCYFWGKIVSNKITNERIS